MKTNEVETCALSDDQLDAVSGGGKADLEAQAKQNALEQAQQAAENKKQGEALSVFQQALQQL
jgi:hypothetical protein